MIKSKSGTIIILFLVFTFFTCIDPYTPKLKGYEAILVVDGLLTNQNPPYSVKISRSFQDKNSIPDKVIDASVSITSDDGEVTYLEEKGNGVYMTDSTNFNGIVGKTYVLHIITAEGDEYASEPCLMRPVPEIDSLYFEKSQEYANNGTEKDDGIMIYLDSKPGTDNTYYRWSFEETWKFKVPSPVRAVYINEDTILAIPATEFCWRKNGSYNVLIRSENEGQSDGVKKESLNFISSDRSDRLLIQYSILVNQYSISRNEFEFWDNLKKVNENGGDIFAQQPFTVTGNIHNINAPGEKVQGYFQVSAVSQKRKYIQFRDIVPLNLPFYHYPCERIERSPSDFPSGWGPPITWDELYNLFCVSSDYYFVEPVYFPGTTKLNKLVFAKPECADCELTGTSKKPDFWVDLN